VKIFYAKDDLISFDNINKKLKLPLESQEQDALVALQITQHSTCFVLSYGAAG